MIANHPLPGEVIRADKNLKFISVAFVGIDHIDTDACKEQGVAISNTGGYCDDAVAELAVGLALDCLRNITECNAAVQSGGGKILLSATPRYRAAAERAHWPAMSLRDGLSASSGPGQSA